MKIHWKHHLGNIDLRIINLRTRLNFILTVNVKKIAGDFGYKTGIRLNQPLLKVDKYHSAGL